MPIGVTCPHCGAKFKAADAAAGKKLKCTKCQGVIQVPASDPVQSAAAQPGALQSSTNPRAAVQQAPAQQLGAGDFAASASASPRPQAAAGQSVGDLAAALSGGGAPRSRAPDKWYVQTSNGETYGPVTMAELNDWYSEGRLDEETQILQEGWDQWKWATDIYPDLASGAGSYSDDYNAGASSGFSLNVGGDNGHRRSGGRENPYSAPVSRGGYDDYGDSDSSTSVGEEVSKGALREVRQSRPWIIFQAVLMSIWMLFMTLGTLSTLIWFPAALPLLIQLTLLGGFGWLLFTIFTLIGRTGDCIHRPSARTLERALNAHKNYWMVIGILAISGFVAGILMYFYVQIQAKSVLDQLQQQQQIRRFP